MEDINNRITKMCKDEVSKMLTKHDNTPEMRQLLLEKVVSELNEECNDPENFGKNNAAEKALDGINTRGDES